MTVTSSLSIIVLMSVVIYFSGSRFATASSRIGDFLGFPRSVKGVTFDAISSSFPELMIALFSVLYFGKFEVGVGAIVGSAIFNLLIIPGISVLVAPVVFKVSKDVVRRDGLFYAGSVIALIIAILASQKWGFWIPVIFIFCYGVYVLTILKDTKAYKETHETKKSTKDIRIKFELLAALGNFIVIGLATFFLTESSIHFAAAAGVPAVLVGFTIAAAATSVPDTVISVINAKKGDVTDAASNVFGSNIFDIFIGLGVPALIAFFTIGPTTILFEQIEVLYGLLFATLLVLWFFRKKYTLTKKHAWVLLGLYAVFFLYVVHLALA